ncbi:hypothetical protein BDZ88DRAFT_52591 [Geranomyces variabilis]|nr:hypothetical protein BDZ88DRAFT_52591 [Geranomyces variabilis]
MEMPSCANNAVVLWVIQNHRFCVMFAVRRANDETVHAEFIGNCQNPLTTKTLLGGTIDALNLFLKAKDLIVGTVQELSLDDSSDFTEPERCPTTPAKGIKPCPYSPVVKRPRLSNPAISTPEFPKSSSALSAEPVPSSISSPPAELTVTWSRRFVAAFDYVRARTLYSLKRENAEENLPLAWSYVCSSIFPTLSRSSHVNAIKGVPTRAASHATLMGDDQPVVGEKSFFAP